MEETVKYGDLPPLFDFGIDLPIQQELYHVSEEFQESVQFVEDTSSENFEPCIEEMEEMDEFASFFDVKDLERNSVSNLINYLKRYPKLVYLENTGREGKQKYELCFERAKLERVLRKKENVVIVSFERSLKHAGLYVTQSTHGGCAIKKWAFKENHVRVYWKPKKRDRENDDLDYQDTF